MTEQHKQQSAGSTQAAKPAPTNMTSASMTPASMTSAGTTPTSVTPTSMTPTGISSASVSSTPTSPPILSQPMNWRHNVLARIYTPAMWLRNSLRHRLGQVSIGTCAIIAKADGTVLLVRHSYRPGWCLPGGGLKPGEIPSVALARELREEVGLELTAPPRLRGIYLQPWFGMIDYPILFIVDGDAGVSGSACVAGGLEILEVGWFPARNLPPDTDASVRVRIADWLAHPDGGPVGAEVW